MRDMVYVNGLSRVTLVARNIQMRQINSPGLTLRAGDGMVRLGDRIVRGRSGRSGSMRFL